MKLTGETVGQRITAAMQHAKLKKTHLAERVGVSFQAVHAWTTEESKPLAANLRRISDVTGVSMRWLQTGSGAPLEPEAESPPAYEEFVHRFGDEFSPDVLEKLKGDPWGRFGVDPKHLTARSYYEQATWLERHLKTGIRD